MILIALGSNIPGPWGNPRQTVINALAELARHNVRVLIVSRLIETAPFGFVNQPNFVNAVARVETAMAPETLMRVLHMIERRAGRKRSKRWGPRTLDLDLLDYHGLIRRGRSKSAKPLQLPHPGIEYRSFVLQPILDVSPRWTHPVSNQPAALTLRQLNRLKQD
jgi:2-amino-4-hydroxy-6-hydroxymethyldihydropteridine diphosphokinase